MIFRVEMRQRQGKSDEFTYIVEALVDDETGAREFGDQVYRLVAAWTDGWDAALEQEEAEEA